MSPSIFSPTADGILAALLAPFFMSLGFFVWDRRWTSSGASAFALNMYKCNVASVGFVVMCLARGFSVTSSSSVADGGGSVFTVATVGYLVLSSVLGIVVGDVLWLEALRLLGAKHVIVIDSLKPFCAAILGRLGLDEVLRAPAWGGMALTVVGVGVVAWEEQRSPKKQEEENANDAEDVVVETHVTERTGFENDGEGVVSSNAPMDIDAQNAVATSADVDADAERKRYGRGYLCAVINVLADSLGSLLTKKHGAGMTTWSINLIRFGFAGVITLCISAGMRIRRHRCSRSDRGRTGSKLETNCGDAETQSSTANAAAKEAVPPLWFELPRLTPMGWLQITAGVGFVTFLCPTLSNYALFQIALGLAVSLSSIGPLYGLLLDWPFRGRRPTFYGCSGVLMTVTGVVILCVWGT